MPVMVRTNRCTSFSSPFPIEVLKAPDFVTKNPSYKGARVGAYKDPLVPTAQICPGDLGWIDVKVPTTAEPGTYPMFGGAQVKVWKMTMPEKPVLPFYTELTFANVAQAHGLAQVGETLTQRCKVNATYRAALRAHRIEPIKQGVEGLPTVTGGLIDVNQPYPTYGCSYSDTVLKGAISPPALWGPGHATSPTFLKAVEDSFKAGVVPPDAWVYSCDEAQCSTSIVQALKAALPSRRIMVTLAQSAAYAPFVTEFWPVFELFKPDSQVHGVYGSCMAQGSCSNGLQGNLTGTPAMVIDAPSVHWRAYMSVAYELGVQNALYYSATVRLTTAWTDQYSEGGQGDGTLILPSQTELAPIMTMRTKAIRAGSYDVQYYEWAKDAGLSFTPPASGTKTWLKNTSDYQKLREALGETLNQI